MTETINVHAAKTHLSSLLDRVARGEEIIIARAGKPVARLVPLVPVERPLGFVQATVDASFFDPLPEELPIRSAHALLAGGFMMNHRDPFDRMLAAQAILEGLPLVTDDPAFSAFADLETIW